MKTFNISEDLSINEASQTPSYDDEYDDDEYYSDEYYDDEDSYGSY